MLPDYYYGFFPNILVLGDFSVSILTFYFNFKGEKDFTVPLFLNSKEGLLDSILLLNFKS